MASELVSHAHRLSVRHSSFSYIIHADSVQRLAFSVYAEVRKRGANMKRRIFIASFGMAATIHPRLLIAQSHMAQVAFPLSSRLPQANPPPFWQAFIEAMRQRGWVEGRNITFHLRAAEGIQERYEQLATELVALHPDVIVITRDTLKKAENATVGRAKL